VAPNFQYMDPNVKAPYSMNFSLTVERALSSSLALETAFVGTRGVKLIGVRSYNLPDRVTGLRPNPSLSSDNYYDNSDSSHYYAWQTSLRKRYSNGLIANLHYTWGKALAYNRGDIGFGGTYIQDFFNIKANKGRPEGDIGHNFVADFVYTIPAPGSWKGIPARAIAQGWELSGIFSARSGLPLVISETGNQRPDLIDLSHAILNTGLQYLNRAAFALVPISSVSGTTIRPGTLGQGVISGPGLWNLDASIAKVFSFRERLQLRFRMDMLNAFNHTNFMGVAGGIQSANFGSFTSTAGARRMQAGLRLTF